MLELELYIILMTNKVFYICILDLYLHRKFVKFNTLSCFKWFT